MVFTSERPNKRVRARERNVGTIHKCQKKVKFGPTMKAIIFVFATYVHSYSLPLKTTVDGHELAATELANILRLILIYNMCWVSQFNQ